MPLITLSLADFITIAISFSPPDTDTLARAPLFILRFTPLRHAATLADYAWLRADAAS